MSSTPPDFHYSPGLGKPGRRMFRVKNFRVVFSASLVSSVGTWMQQVVFAAFAFKLTESAAFVGQLVFAQLGPTLVLGLFAGVLADCFDRKRVLVVTSLGQTVSALTLALLVLSDHPARWALLAVAAVDGVLKAVYQPAFSALVPSLVEPGDLASAVALTSAGQNAARVIGPALGGLGYEAFGASGVFFINAASCLYIAVALMTLQITRSVRIPLERVHQLLAGGVRVATRDAVIRKCLVGISVFAFCSLLFVNQMPVIASENLGIDESSLRYGVLYAFFGSGAVVGALIVGTGWVRRRLERMVRLGLLVFAVALAAFGLTRNAPLAHPLALLVGASYMTLATSMNTLVQLRLSDQERGRVSAVWTVSFVGLVALSSLVFGPAIDSFGITTFMVAGAVVALALAIALDYRVRSADVSGRFSATREPQPSRAL